MTKKAVVPARHILMIERIIPPSDGPIPMKDSAVMPLISRLKPSDEEHNPTWPLYVQL